MITSPYDTLPTRRADAGAEVVESKANAIEEAAGAVADVDASAEAVANETDADAAANEAGAADVDAEAVDSVANADAVGVVDTAAYTDAAADEAEEDEANASAKYVPPSAPTAYVDLPLEEAMASGSTGAPNAVPLECAPRYTHRSFRNRGEVKECTVPFEKSLLVSDALPDMAEILFIEGSASLTQPAKSLYSSSDSLSGEVTLYTVYRPAGDEESSVDVVKSTVSFQAADCMSDDENACYKVSVRLHQVSADMINERKFTVSGEVVVCLTRIDRLELNEYCESTDTNLVAREEGVMLTALAFEKEDQVDIMEEIKLGEGQPEPVKILNRSIHIAQTHKQTTSGKLVINAVIHTQILYLGSMDGEEKLASLTHRTDFTQFIPLQESMDTNLILVEFQGDDLELSIAEDGGFTLEGPVHIFIQGYENQTICAASDAYHKERELVFDIEAKPAYAVIKTVSGELSAREVVNIEDGQAKPDRILYSALQEGSLQACLADGRLVLEGSLPVKILALDDEEAPFTISAAVPLRGSLDSSASSGEPSAPELHVRFTVKDLWADTINSRQIEININVCVEVWVSRQLLFPELKDFRLLTPDGKLDRVFLALYTVKRGDSLWDIAKRYRTDMQALAESNQLDPNTPLLEGMKLLIMK